MQAQQANPGARNARSVNGQSTNRGWNGTSRGSGQWNGNNNNGQWNGSAQGRGNGQWQGRGGNNNNGQWNGNRGNRGSWNGNQWRSNRGQWTGRNVWAHNRFNVGRYRAPYGYNYRRWSYGEFLPFEFFGQQFWLNDYSNYDLPYPPPGCEWVRYGSDALLVDSYSGEILQVVYGIFY